MIEFQVTGDFTKTNKFLEKLKNIKKIPDLDKYGQMGVDALKAATPVDTGLTAASWSYEIIQGNESTRLIWKNSNTTDNGIPIVILLQYGHATGSGHYVQGRDFINPALQPVFDRIAEEAWGEVTRL